MKSIDAAHALVRQGIWSSMPLNSTRLMVRNYSHNREYAVGMKNCILSMFRQPVGMQQLNVYRNISANVNFCKIVRCPEHALMLDQYYGLSVRTLCSLAGRKPDIRCFHTTQPCQIGLPPLIWMFARYVAKVVVALAGRRVRVWWRTLPEHEREKVITKFVGRREKIGFYGVILLTVIAIYYYSHYEKTPISGRKRFIAFTPSQFDQLMQYQERMIMQQLKGQLIQATHPVYKKVERVVKRILAGNRDLDTVRNKKWAITVVDDMETRNAFVLPTGHIFVCSGILKMTANDDQLGVVLSHEMAHALLSHAAEQVSFAQFIDVFIIFVMAAIWVVLPTDGLAVATTWFFDKVVDLMLHLPYSRLLEREADAVGLQLAAKSCFDVREATAFWMRMQMLEQSTDDAAALVPEFLSTHPTHLNRTQYVDALVPDAITLRNECRCPPLPRFDPRQDILAVQKRLSKMNDENDLERFMRRIQI